MRAYSRLAGLEEKRNIRRSIIFLFLTVVSLLAIIFFGIPMVVKIASFVGDLKKGGSPVDIADITPPAPPRIDPLPEAVDKPQITITGSTESGATVVLFVNDTNLEVVATNDGVFTSSIDLNKGQNSISALAKDRAGNESQKTKTVFITFDNEEPKIDISNPKDGQQFAGSKQANITIQGSTEPGSTLTINDRFVRVGDSGNFSFQVTLSEGANTFNFKVQDKAGNSSEKSIAVQFSL